MKSDIRQTLVKKIVEKHVVHKKDFSGVFS